MERDDIIEYSLHNHHSEEEGKKVRKKIYFVTFLLSAITILEVVVGIFMSRANTFGAAWETIKWMYVALTVVKAYYIVMTFMHLGEERRDLKQWVLVSYLILIIYTIIVLIDEGNAVGHDWSFYGV
ncbi:MAG: cytochrome C oxidase subunit IV family protein [Crocinitomicaceae bacterium]|nr:cytochrome C oxidase subunit IV family protein [Crocinitomicaceae bacterium]